MPMLCKKYVDTALDSLCSAASFRTVVVLAHLHSHSSTILLVRFHSICRDIMCACVGVASLDNAHRLLSFRHIFSSTF